MAFQTFENSKEVRKCSTLILVVTLEVTQCIYIFGLSFMFDDHLKMASADVMKTAGVGCSKDDQLKPGLVENHGTKFGASASECWNLVLTDLV